MARRALVGTLAAIALLAGGCGGDSDPPYDGEADPASIVPADAAAYLVLDVAPRGAVRDDAARIIRRLSGRPDAGAVAREIATTIVSRGRRGVTYDHNLKPWLGRRVAFFTIISAEGVSSAGAVYAAKDPARGLTLVRASGGVTRRLTYHGVAVLESPSTAWLAAVGQFVVVGPRTAVRAVIDARHGRSLLALPAYRRSLAALPSQRLASFYVDPDALLRLLPLQAALVMPDALRQLGLAEPDRPIAGALTVDRNSIGVDLATQAKGRASRLLAGVPGGTDQAGAVGDLGGTIRAAIATARVLGAGSDVDRAERTIRRFTGLDAERDLLPWMGDAAYYLIGDAKHDAVTIGVTIATRRPALAQRAIRRLARVLSNRAQVTPLQLPGLGTGFRVGPATGYRIEVVGGRRSVIGVLGSAGVAQAADPSRRLAQTAPYAAARRILGGLPVYLAALPSLRQFPGMKEELRDPEFAGFARYLGRLGVLAAGVATTPGGRVIRIAIEVP